MREPIRVLIVDDNPDHAGLAVEFLRASGDYHVDTAGDIEACWQRLRGAAYDVLLLDYNLPDGTGLDALAEIPTRGYQLPVVMVTGRGDERVAALAIQRGAVDYLVKAGDYLRMLPALVEKAVRTHALMQAAQRSLDEIRYHAMLLDNVRDAVVVWSPDGRVTFWNRAAEQLFGWTADEMVGQSSAARYLAAFEPPIEAPRAGQPVHDVERQFRPEGVGRRWVSSTVTTIKNADDLIVGFMDVSRDITGRKQLEAQVRQAQQHLAEAARLSAIGELASGVAHQISNPLTTIIAEAQLLQHQIAADHPARESADLIGQAGWRAQDAVQKLLDFSRPDTGSLESLDVNDSLRRAALLVGAHIEAAGVALELQPGEGLPLVRGNARQLEDLWVNLLLQARDATAAGGAGHNRLCSRAGPGPAAIVEVWDDGAPIEPGQLATIFEPDFVGFSDGRGSGLELSICREIVRQHQGQITARSQPGGGTVFAVSLPGEERTAERHEGD